MKKVLTIAGSDSSGGAGIQADLKTFTAHKVYGMSAITAITVQNTQGVFGVHDIPADIVAGQIDAVFDDIVPDAVKIGMVSSVEIITVIAEKLKQHQAKNVVLDPVMVSTSGCKLLADNAVEALTERLFPVADILTPNIYEAELLWGREIHDREAMLDAAKWIAGTYNQCVLLKGGHLTDCSDDLLYGKGVERWFPCPRIENPNTHGTGCTLSSAIASNLALGKTMEEAVSVAKGYITGALEANLDIGKGNGPLNHCYNL